MDDFGRRLRLARKRIGLSMKDLVERMDRKVSVQAISKYESGKMLPSSSVLVDIAKALDVSLDFLMSSQIESVERVDFRKTSQASARELAKTEAIVIDKLERYLAVESILGLTTDIAWADSHVPVAVATEPEIDEVADALRHDWKLGFNPIPSLCEVLEDKGIKVILANLPESVNGLACQVHAKGNTKSHAVVVSDNLNVERKRFTLAHELAHRVIETANGSDLKPEATMNRFAGAFLMPKEHLVREVGDQCRNVSIAEIMRLKKIYGVSAAAMIERLGQVGVLRTATVRYAFQSFARGWRKKEPGPVSFGFAELETPLRFERLVYRALAEELISPIRAATLLDKPLVDIERSLGANPIG